MFQSKSIRCALLVSAICAAFSLNSTLASATLVDVDFGGAATGAGVIGTATDQWNNLGGFSSANLNDTHGNPTGIALTGSANGISGTYAHTVPNPTITTDYAYTVSNTPISMSLSGLTANGNYQLYLYSVTDNCCGGLRPASFSVDPSNGGQTGTVTAVTNLTTWASGQNYIEFDVHANGSGVLSFQVAQTRGEADINGFQLQSPEPSSFILCGLGAVGLLVAARRRRKA
jgi:hypothetical protein